MITTDKQGKGGGGGGGGGDQPPLSIHQNKQEKGECGQWGGAGYGCKGE